MSVSVRCRKEVKEMLDEEMIRTGNTRTEIIEKAILKNLMKDNKTMI
ncbi:MAG: ribbon-helix-helix protein, CopG family [Cetobacterium sp.]